MSKKIILPPLPKISDILRIYGVRAKKQLSQNFILDQNITDKIVSKADVYDCFVCEVGSGPGSLTRSVLHAGARQVAAVEIDQRFIPALELLADCSDGKMTVHNENIMKFNVCKAFPNAEGVEWEKDYLPSVRLVGNLPFNVSIPLLLQWLQAVSARIGPFTFGRVPMSLVFQKEVADNISAPPGHPNSSRLSAMTQHLCEVKRSYSLPRTVFVPEPKVDAVLLHVVPRKTPEIDAPYEVVEQVVKALFSKRRKFIRSSLRSHGRPPKMVVVKGQCVQLTKNHLRFTIDTTPSLKDLPFFHMFWTDCQDFDEYRNVVKEKITIWLQNIKANGNTDWLIVQVITQGSINRNKPKLQLPRSSVFDKIKSDFGGGKANERCIQLWEPSKHDANPKSVESWLAFMSKLRYSVLAAVDRNLKKIDEKVRNTRDRRTERSWDFINYFLCHEEVALVFEMMHLNEDALIHYDEIDALLGQLVEQVKASDHSGPLAMFTGECWCWDGASISPSTEKRLHDKIRKKEATFLDMRNYLFIRQCALLFQLDRVKVVLQRMLHFMHVVVHELAILNVSMPTGASACWVTLSSLQLIRSAIQKNAEIVTYNLHTAQIYQYAKQKLFEVGHMCGLMPDETPTSQQLNLACNLCGGVGKDKEVRVSEGSPSNKLKSALSSKNGFKALYLELLEMAIKTYKNIKRNRIAKVLGIDLGKFYMSGGSYGDAELLLTDGYKMFAEEGWGLLAANTLLSLAQCQYELRKWEKYAQSCAVLACQSHLKEESTSYYTQELLRLKDDPQHEAKPLTIRAQPLFKPDVIKIHLDKNIATIGEIVFVDVEIDSGLTQVVDECSLKVTTRMTLTTQDSEPIRLTNDDDKQESTNVNASSSESSIGTTQSESKSKEKYSLESEKVQLLPGRHLYHLKGQVKKSGSYLLSQLLITLGNIHLFASLTRSPKAPRKFIVVSESPALSWAKGTVDVPLVAGHTNVISLSVSTGPAAILDQSVLEVTSESGLLFQPVTSGVTVVTSQDNELYANNAKYRIEVHEDEAHCKLASRCYITLPFIPAYHKTCVDLLLFSNFEETDPEQPLLDHDVFFLASWLSLNNLSTLFLTFYKPFLIQHISHRKNYGHFLQVILTGATSTNITICSADLQCEGKPEKNSSEPLPLHSSSSQALFHHSELSYVWRMDKEFSSSLVLSVVYFCMAEGKDNEWYTHRHRFQFTHFAKISSH
ncbi:trafficking protein particle complex subunit 10-like [Xenia sp. Carnegie-2017]|uniref:trafficking protein particle complex subunit 10-like n=1 Tax=Xenia sp. Carnegie-2017 TaxID=2897299 RepID=UPI001F04DD7E|nr:trafficking protein particle complex subunit 10-like [Xenia sp. Carnegie-2017]